MSIAIPLGWWIAPIVITVAVFAIAWRNEDNSPAGDYGRIGQGIGNAVIYGMALIVSLFAWLLFFIVA